MMLLTNILIIACIGLILRESHKDSLNKGGETMLDKGMKEEIWTPEQIAAHLQQIGADKKPTPKNEFGFRILAPKQGRWGKYLK